MKALRTWLINGRVLFPKIPQPLSDRLAAASRIPMDARVIHDVRVSIAPATKQSPDLLHEWAQLSGRVAAEAPEDALDIAVPVLEDVLKSMSFQMQDVLRFDSMEALDVTPPVEVGDERDMIISPSPHGHPSIVFSPASVVVGTPSTPTTPDPWLQLSTESAKARRALDWYLKALAATLQVDQFIFLWISTEILSSDSKVLVEAHFTADCGHTISACPQCGRSTARKALGKTMQAFLRSEFGLPVELAQTAWEMRQMLHGAVGFDSARMETLPDLCSALRAGILVAIKKALAIDARALPTYTIEDSFFSIMPGLQLLGSRAVTEEDLAS